MSDPLHDPFDVKIMNLTYRAECEWLQGFREKYGSTIDNHPLYLALTGNIEPLNEWCTAQGNIWPTERIGYVLEVYRSLILYGQLQPITITRKFEIVTGHKRTCCMRLMGFKTIKAVFEE